MSSYRAEYAAPHTWACTNGTTAGTTIHDSKEAAEAYAKVQNERLSWGAQA